MSKQYEGKITLHIGCMFSGKTSNVINAYNRHIIGGRKCLLVKYSGDTRYSNSAIVTHSEISKKADVTCRYLFEIDHIVGKYDVICIDEIQFYKDAPIMCDKWANEGLIIEAGGLNGTFERDEFRVISALLPRVEHVNWNMAVCRGTGKEAVYTRRTSNETTTEVIGGTDKYVAVDRKTYFTSMEKGNLDKYENNEFCKFVNFVDDNYKLNLSNTDKDNINKSFSETHDKDYMNTIISYLERHNIINADHPILLFRKQ